MPVLYIITTPVGNLEDISHRALRILGEVEVLATEDTRRTRKIFEHYQISVPPVIFSCHEHNEEFAAGKIISHLKAGRTVGLCSDSGSPGISDPGYRVIDQALQQGFRVEVIPGASAVITALISSGLPTSSFTFKGFPPRKSGQRLKFLQAEQEAPHTLIFYESPFRIHKLLNAALEVYGDRLAAVCRELTKLHEEVRRGYLSDLSIYYSDRKVKGEITVVIAGHNPKFLKPSAID